MSLYNLMHGANIATFLFLPMLGEKHPDDYPRFRDCFVNIEEGKPAEIHVYTRVGGNNRMGDYGEVELYKHPNFLNTWDDEFDSTFATYSFSVPEEWKADFDLLVSGKITEVSKAYQDRMKAVYPKLAEKFEAMFVGNIINKPSN